MDKSGRMMEVRGAQLKVQQSRNRISRMSWKIEGQLHDNIILMNDKLLTTWEVLSDAMEMIKTDEPSNTVWKKLEEADETLVIARSFLYGIDKRSKHKENALNFLWEARKHLAKAKDLVG